MTAPALVLHPNGGVEKLEALPDLAALQMHVGGWIEAIQGPHWTMYVNEEGLLHGLPPNPQASRLAGVPLVGACVLVGEPDREGNDTPLTTNDLGVLTP